MKILHIISTLDPSKGGPPAVASQLASAQAALGHEVRIACYASDEARPRIDKLLQSLPDPKALTIEAIPHDGRMESLTARLARTHLNRSIPHVDIVHIHGVWETMLPAAAAIARRARVPYAVAPHGMLYPWALDKKGLKKRLALALLYRSMLRNAAFIHVVNSDEADGLPLWLGARTESIPNGIFASSVERLPEAGRYRASLPALGDDPFVLFLSRLHPGKGLDVLCEGFAAALQSVRHARLVVAGPDDGALASFRAQAASLGIQDRVHVVGPIYGSAKLEAIRDAAVFCLPSEHESFGLVILEAMACARPVVISPECHFPEVAAARAGLKVPRTGADVGNALVTLLSDSAEAAAMGERGRRLALERFTWDRIAAGSIEAYTRAIGGRRS